MTAYVSAPVLPTVLFAVGVAAGLAVFVPGIVVWPVSAFGATATFLLVGGVDVLIARRTARGADATRGMGRAQA